MNDKPALIPTSERFVDFYGVELYRRFGVSNYKAIALDQFAQVLAFLDEWRQQIEGNTHIG